MSLRSARGILPAAVTIAATAFGQPSLADSNQGGSPCVEVVTVEPYMDLGNGKVMLLPGSVHDAPNDILQRSREMLERQELPDVMVLHRDGRLEPHRTTLPWPTLSTDEDGRATPGKIGAACGIPGGLTFRLHRRGSLA